MTANVEGMINAAINAYNNGDKAEARAFLDRALELEEMNEKAWLWMSAVVDSPEEQQTCLENVLVINPANERAKAGLRSLGLNPEPTPAESAFDAPPTETSVQWASDTPAATPPPVEDDSGIATSSASSAFRGQETSKEEYDDWLNGLNIGTNAAPADDPGAANVANALAGAGIQQSEFETELNSLFGSDDDDDEDEFDDYPAAPTLTEEPEEDEPMMTSGPFDGGGLFDEMDFDEQPPATAAPAQPPRQAIMSPGAENIGFEDEEPASRRAQTPRQAVVSSPADEDDALMGELEPNAYFVFIPEDIKATRLPGEDESYPTLVIIGLVAVVLLNLAGLGLLVMGLLG